MEKSSSSSSSPRKLTLSSQEEKAESPKSSKPIQRAPLGDFIERQPTVTANRRQYLSQNTARSKNADDVLKGKNNPRWEPVSPSTRATPRGATNQNPLILPSPRSSNFVELETDVDAADNISSTEAPATTARPLEKMDESSHLLEKEYAFSLTISGRKPRKTKLPKLTGLPKFGGLNKRIISPRNKIKSEKMPTISRGNMTRSTDVEEQYVPYEELSSIYDPTLFSPYEIREPIILPNASAKDFTPADLVNVLVNLFNNPSEQFKDIDLRVMNILYCATGAEGVLENSNSYPEIGAFAEFLSRGQDDPIYTTMYMNALFKALTPRLSEKLQKELEHAFFENRDGVAELQKCLGRHLAKAIPVTMDNVAKVFSMTNDVPGEKLSRRAMNLIGCAAGRMDSINQSDLYPETGAFANSLTDLPDDKRFDNVKLLTEKLGSYIGKISLGHIDGFGENVRGIKEYCKRVLD